MQGVEISDMKLMASFQCAVLLVLVSASAVLAEEPRGSRAIYNTFTDEEEMTMGRTAAEDVEKTQPILADAELTEYVERVGQKLAAASQRKELQYHFKIVDSPAVNAFSLPGGYVYVNRALLDVVESEGELAGVLGHEVGHVVGFHSMNDVARRWLVDRVMYEGQKAGLVRDQQIQDMLQKYGGTALLFVNRKFSREEENEADLLGIYNAVRAGWEPNGLITFLNRLIGAGAGQDLYELLLRHHPLPEERVKALTAELKTSPPAKSLKKSSGAFRLMKDRLQTLPPPPPARKLE